MNKKEKTLVLKILTRDDISQNQPTNTQTKKEDSGIKYPNKNSHIIKNNNQHTNKKEYFVIK